MYLRFHPHIRVLVTTRECGDGAQFIRITDPPGSGSSKLVQEAESAACCA